MFPKNNFEIILKLSVRKYKIAVVIYYWCFFSFVFLISKNFLINWIAVCLYLVFEAYNLTTNSETICPFLITYSLVGIYQGLQEIYVVFLDPKIGVSLSLNIFLWKQLILFCQLHFNTCVRNRDLILIWPLPHKLFDIDMIRGDPMNNHLQIYIIIFLKSISFFWKVL